MWIRTIEFATENEQVQRGTKIDGQDVDRESKRRRKGDVC